MAKRDTHAVVFALTSGLGLACGSASQSGTNEIADPPKYYLDRSATNKTLNALIINLDPKDGFQFSLEGDSFTAAVPFDDIVPIQRSVSLEYEAEGKYQLGLRVYQSDGKLFIEDSLEWEYSLKAPKKPIVAFSEAATRDPFVVMTVASSRDVDANEVWIEGDIAADYPAEGFWAEVPSTGLVPFSVSDGDGVKSFNVRLRNKFGNESSDVPLSIERKDLGPTNCESFVSTNTTKTGTIRLKISAENSGSLFYTVLGDVAKEEDYAEFNDEVVTPVKLSAGNGEKTINVFVRDLANNYCDVMTHKIIVDPTYESESLQVNDGGLWTDSRDVVLTPHFEFVPGDNPEMFIYGNVVASDNTFGWIPFESTVAVTLTLVDGTRNVLIKYRRGSFETNAVAGQIHLIPKITISGIGGTRTLGFSDIVGTETMSVSGCDEEYNHIAYQATLPCTVNGTVATVTYYLSDGTSVTRSSEF